MAPDFSPKPARGRNRRSRRAAAALLRLASEIGDFRRLPQTRVGATFLPSTGRGSSTGRLPERVSGAIPLRGLWLRLVLSMMPFISGSSKRSVSGTPRFATRAACTASAIARGVDRLYLGHTQERVNLV